MTPNGRVSRGRSTRRRAIGVGALIALLGFTAAPAIAHAAVGWYAAPSMSVPRAQQTSTLLPDGKVLVAGGYDGFVENVGGGHVSLASAELFDPATNSWGPAAPMHRGRSDQRAVLLDDGDVLVVGGWEQPGCCNEGTRTAEIYDPATDTWTATSPPPELQVVDTATLLNGGDVLVTGLFGPSEYMPSIGAVEYLPGSGTWTAVATPPSAAERDRIAVRLPDGEVLLAGGISTEQVFEPPHPVEDRQTAYADAEVLDPATDTWTPVAPMQVARIAPTATLLPGGQVLVTGGLAEVSPAGAGAGLASTEAFDPATGTWTARAPMSFARGKHTASLLADGRVLVTGGSDCSPRACIGFGATSGCCAADTAEIYDPAADAWTATEPVLTLAEHAASVLPDGAVLVSGGNFEPGDTHESTAAEIYGDLPPPTETSPPPSLRLWDLHQSHRRWREPGATAAGGKRRRPTAPVGTTFNFELSEPASVTFHFHGSGTSRATIRRCARIRRDSGPGSCRDLRGSGAITVAAHAGANQIAFRGGLPSRGRLAPGPYTVIAVATASGSVTEAPGLHLKIVAQ
jgi:hypothetical protein